MTRPRSLIAFVLVVLTACDENHRGAEVGQADASAGDGADASSGLRCDDLRFSRTEGEVTTALLQFVDHMRSAGATDVTFDTPPDGTSSALFLQAIHVELGGGPGADPTPAVLSWLAAVRDSPIDPAEYSGRLGADGHTLTLTRESIEGEPFLTGAPADPDWAVPALQVSLSPGEGGWGIQGATIWPFVVFATRNDAQLQRECTSMTPPSDAAIRAHRFSGTEMTGCAPDGVYEYLPRPEDSVSWLGGPLWLGTARTSGDPDEHSLWLPQRRSTLTIDPANYWTRMAHADCYCDGAAGFTIDAHALTGEVLDVRPGINCVVC